MKQLSLLNLIQTKQQEHLKLQRSLLDLECASDSNYTDLQSRIIEQNKLVQQVQQNKRNTIQVFKQKKAVMSNEQTKLELAIEKLSLQQKRMQGSIENLNSQIMMDKNNHKDTFNWAIKPLVDSLQLIKQQRSEIQNNHSRIKDQIGNLKHQQEQFLDELKQRKRSIDQLNGKKQQIQQSYQQVKDHYQQEFNCFMIQMHNKDLISEIKQKRYTYLASINELQQEIMKIEDKIAANKVKLQEMVKQHNVITEFDSEQVEIKQIEKYLKLKALELNIEPFENTIVIENYRQNYDIGLEISKEQIDILEKNQSQLQVLWKDRKRKLNEQIDELYAKQEQLGAIVQQGDSTGQQSRQYMKLKQDILKTLHLIDTEQKVFNHKNQLIDREKVKLIEQVSDYESSKTATDQSLIDRYLEIAEAKNIQQQQYDQLQEMLFIYHDKVSIYEQNLEQSKQVSQTMKFRIDTLKNNIDTQEVQRLDKVSQQEKVQNQLNQLHDEELHLKKEYADSKLQSSSFIEKSLQVSLNAFLENKQKQQFTNQRSFGKRIAKSMIEKDIKEFELKFREQVDKRREKMEQMYSDYKAYDEQIRDIEIEINEKILNQLNKIGRDVIQLESEKQDQSQKLEILIEAEDEAQAKIDKLSETKGKQIRESKGKIIRQFGADTDYQKYQKVCNLLETKVQKLDQMQEQLHQLTTDFQEKMGELRIMESRDQTTLSQLQEQMQIMQKNQVLKQTLAKKAFKVQNELKSLGATPEPVSLITSIFSNEKDISPVGRLDNILEQINNIDDSPVQQQNFSDKASQNTDTDAFQLEIETIKYSIAQTLQYGPKIDLPQQTVHIKLEELTPDERRFFMKVSPFLEGLEYYKKFSSKNTMNFQEFDPLDVKSPEQCGYGLRDFKFDKKLLNLEIRTPGRSIPEQTIPLTKLRASIIPNHTMKIIKQQKAAWLTIQEPSIKSKHLDKKYQLMKKSNIIDYYSSVFEEKAKGCRMYQFNIAFEGGRLDLVARSYSEFKAGVDGVNQTVKFAKMLQRLKFYIED